MSKREVLSSLTDHEYYGPLIELYTKSILKSGLLLDEDLEVLLSVSEFKCRSSLGRYKPSIMFLASIASVLCSSLLAKRYQLPLIIIPPVIFALKSISSEILSIRKETNNKQMVDKLIENMKKVHSLNTSIIRYMKAREDLGKTKNSLLTVYNKNVKEFLQLFLHQECELFQCLVDALKSISSYSPELCDDYVFLMTLNPVEVIKSHSIDTLQDCLTLFLKIQDLHVLFASKLISYFGIVCYSQTRFLNAEQLDTLLDKKLPSLAKYFQQHHDVIRKQFLILRQSITKKSKYKIEAAGKLTEKKHIKSKLRETLASSVNNLSIILEKSQNLLGILDHDNQTNLGEISDAVLDLRNHSFATSESLDLLCRLYGILANSSTDTQYPVEKCERPKGKDVNPEYATINYDDTIEPLEEKFEVYIGDQDLASDASTSRYEGEHSHEYLSLMLRELRQSLRQHQRFIDAKNRRGSDDDEEVIRKDSCIRLKKSPPKFNLTVIKDENKSSSSSNTLAVHLEPDTQDVLSCPSVCPLAPPPPPPPLHLSFQIDKLEIESGQINARSMLDNIRTLSSQINIQEDVFGDSDVDTSSSDD